MSYIKHIRRDLQDMQAYTVQDASGMVKLDAMENPYTLPPHLRTELAQRLSDVAINRYPVPSYFALKEKICSKLGVPAGFDVVLGNGSDELISMISVACAKPGATVLAPVPTFVMYAMSAKFAGLDFVGVPLKSDFSLDKAAMLEAIAKHKPAVTYLAYPNNPTANLFDVDAMEEIIRAVGNSGVVIVDEAYQPFAQASFMNRLADFDNLIVMRTVSKLGLAGIRLGYMSASAALLAEFEKVRPPYNINVLTQTTAEFVLEHIDVLNTQAALLREERTKLVVALTALPGLHIYSSAANFVLVRVNVVGKKSDDIYSKLLDRKILVKNVGKMHVLLENCWRITVSTPEENAAFLDALRDSLN